MAKKKNAPHEMKTYIVQRKGGKDQKITVPASWKVTFGPLVPGSKNFEGNASPALRFYESENQQRAVITDVICFRDSSIHVEEKRVSVKQQTLHKQTGAGQKEVIVEGRVEEWVNPDAPQQGTPEFFKLEHKPEDEPGTF
jgi:hypothetical protein